MALGAARSAYKASRRLRARRDGATPTRRAAGVATPLQSAWTLRGVGSRDLPCPPLPSAHSLNHQRICPTGLDPPRPIVVPGGGAQIAVSKQVAGNADLIRRGDSPGGCRRHHEHRAELYGYQAGGPCAG